VANTKPNQDPEEYLTEKKHEEWDCETVVSTYSNLENHPSLLDADIQRIKVSRKTGFALGVLPEKKRHGLGAVHEEEEDEEDERVNLGKARSKGETKEEKKARKALLKEEKKNRRAEKKDLKQEYKKEEERQKDVIVKNRGYKVSMKHMD